jgi:hypothetical protein
MEPNSSPKTVNTSWDTNESADDDFADFFESPAQQNGRF